jgi:hypothetical protein
VNDELEITYVKLLSRNLPAGTEYLSIYYYILWLLQGPAPRVKPWLQGLSKALFSQVNRPPGYIRIRDLLILFKEECKAVNKF